MVGVHSGKYTAERDTARIREAALRLGVEHPIVNDRQFRVWREYTVRAWPTLVIVDPLGAVLGTHAGEFSADQLAMFIGRVIDAYDQTGDMSYEPRAARVDRGAIAPGTLRYPGKVAVDAQRIAIADTGHHRVLVGRLARDGRAMRVERVVGGGTAGWRDGADPLLHSPQGLAFDGDTLHVADPGSHTVRGIALGTGIATTLAGTGAQLRTHVDLEAGALSSPWDVTRSGDSLFVAMAGTHQLYAIDLETHAVRAHGGTGREEIVDGPLDEAALAQPMGIAAAGGRLYFVDAESSAVRWASATPRGEVRTIVGTGLFDFGDADGVGDAVRMQHQQGIAVHRDGRLLVCDTYNDALKWVDPATRAATTWVRDLHEPTGVALADGLAYVADQNAHRIAVIDEATGSVEELAIEL